MKPNEAAFYFFFDVMKYYPLYLYKSLPNNAIAISLNQSCING